MKNCNNIILSLLVSTPRILVVLIHFDEKRIIDSLFWKNFNQFIRLFNGNYVLITGILIILYSFKSMATTLKRISMNLKIINRIMHKL